MRIDRNGSPVRNYRPGDETALVALWNLAYASYGGYVPRTLEYWRWCILERPGVTPQDLFILQDGRNISAYSVLDPKGTVLEFAVDPTLSSRKREEIATQLIGALEERSRIRGDEVIQFDLPHTDEPIRSALQRTGYDEEKGGCLNMVIIDLAGLLTKILTHRLKRIPEGWSPTFFFEIQPGDYRFCPYRQLYIQIGPPVVIKTDSIAASADYIVKTDYSTLTDLIFRRTTVERAMASGCITFHPKSGAKDVETLMGLLPLDGSWYTPYADGR